MKPREVDGFSYRIPYKKMNVRMATDIIWASLYKTRPVVALGELPIHVLPGPAHTHSKHTQGFILQ